VALGERRLDCRLPLAEPVERGVEFGLVDLAQAEHTAQARARRRRVEVACRRQLRGRMNNPADEQRKNEIAHSRRRPTEQPVEADAAQRSEHRRDMTVRQRAMDLQPVARHRMTALEQGAQTLDQIGRPVRQIEEGPLLDLAALPIALAQEHRGRRVPIGHAFDVHAPYRIMDFPSWESQKCLITWLHS
jgi:hypothetical protein